jgi:hypothetical protein
MTIVKLNVSSAHVTEQHINEDVEPQIQSLSFTSALYEDEWCAARPDLHSVAPIFCLQAKAKSNSYLRFRGAIITVQYLATIELSRFLVKMEKIWNLV